MIGMLPNGGIFTIITAFILVLSFQRGKKLLQVLDLQMYQAVRRHLLL